MLEGWWLWSCGSLAQHWGQDACAFGVTFGQKKCITTYGKKSWLCYCKSVCNYESRAQRYIDLNIYTKFLSYTHLSYVYIYIYSRFWIGWHAVHQGESSHHSQSPFWGLCEALYSQTVWETFVPFRKSQFECAKDLGFWVRFVWVHFISRFFNVFTF